MVIDKNLINSGFLLIDKPLGWTSFDIVKKLRGITKTAKIGHAGTLDPCASGLLIVAVGQKATKQIDRYMKLDKEYVADIKLGYFSTTYDCEGELKHISDIVPDKHTLKNVLKKFIGDIEQIPPMFSAKKIQGKKLYDLARKGIEVARKPSKIQIFDIKILLYEYPLLKIKVRCSSGTYIRSLAHDLGNALCVGGYLTALRRTKINEFKVEKASMINQINRDNWEDLLIKV